MINRLNTRSSALKILFLFLWIVVFSYGHGAYAEEKKFSLRIAIMTALENNREMLALRSSLSAKEEDIGIARSHLLPVITFEERFMRTNSPTYVFSSKLNERRFSMEDFAVDSLNNPSAVNDFQTMISFQQPVFAPKANIGLNMAETEGFAKKEEFTRKREEIALKVARTYLMLFTAREYAKVAEKAVKDAREHLRIAKLRYDSGLGLYSDTLRASTALAEAEQKLVSSQKNLSVTKRALGLLLGISDEVDISDDVPDIPLMQLEYYNNSAASRKDVKALELRYENAKNNVRLAEAGYLPVIGIGGAYQMNDHNNLFGSEGRNWQVSAFLRWDLFDGAKRDHERAKARHEADEAREYLNMLKDSASFKVNEAFLTVQEAVKNTEFSLQALKTAEEGRRLVSVRYENSLSPIFDLLDSQVNLDHARASLVARENEYRSAIISLSYESGAILKDLKIE